MSAPSATNAAELTTAVVPRRPAWRERLVLLERGVMLGFRSSSIVMVHFFCGLLGLTAGLVLGLGLMQWCVLVLCFTTSLSAELAHQGIKRLARCSSLGRDDSRCAVQLSTAATTLALCGGILVSLLILISRGCELW
jgi:diacylglycerol kinase